MSTSNKQLWIVFIVIDNFSTTQQSWHQNMSGMLQQNHFN